MYGLYQPNYQANFQQTRTQDERIWVSNEQAAESYLLAPSGFVRLWDSSKPVFYEKRADATGRPLPMDVYEYSRVMPQIATPNDDTIKLSFDDINAKIDAINERIDTLEKVKKGAVKNAKQSDADDTNA